MSHFNVIQRSVKPFTAHTLFLGLFLIMFASSAFAGGDTYEIYLNNKLVFKQRVLNASAVDLNSLPLTNANYNDELTIYYSHCGVTGTGRSIEIKDQGNKVLRQWQFKDAIGSNTSMTIPVKEILDLQKKNPNAVLNLYYFSSKYLPSGRMLALIKMEGKTTTMKEDTNGNDDVLVVENIQAMDFLFWRI